MKRRPKPTAMTSAWTTSAWASSRRPAPSRRATADEIPPPMAPADIICISISTGKTSATPASASVPSLATKYVSMSPTDACASMTSTFGVARRTSVLAMGASSSTRVRASNGGAVAGGAATSGGGEASNDLSRRHDRVSKGRSVLLGHDVALARPLGGEEVVGRVDEKGQGGLQAEGRTDVDDRAATLALHVRDHRP